MNRATQRRLAKLETQRRSRCDDLADDEAIRRGNEIVDQLEAELGVEQAHAVIEAHMMEAGKSAADVAEILRSLRALRNTGI